MPRGLGWVLSSRCSPALSPVLIPAGRVGDPVGVMPMALFNDWRGNGAGGSGRWRAGCNPKGSRPESERQGR